MGTHICASCLRSKVEPFRSRCAGCGKSSLYGFTHPGCTGKNQLDGVYSLYRYDGLARTLIRTMKYYGAYRVAEDIEQALDPEIVRTIRTVVSMWSPDYIIPVPLHVSKERKRGFNQAARIAELFSHLVCPDIPIESSVIQRTRNTSPQSALSSYDQRHANVHKAFAISSSEAQTMIVGKTIVVVDDIWTSGSTMREISTVLKYNGVARVYIFTFAHG